MSKIAAIFKQGLYAMHDAHDIGEDTDAAFLLDPDNETDNNNNNNHNVAKIKEEVIVCPECKEAGPLSFHFQQIKACPADFGQL